MKDEKANLLEQQIIAMRSNPDSALPVEPKSDFAFGVMASIRKTQAKASLTGFENPGIAAIIWRAAGVCAVCSVVFFAYLAHTGVISESDDYVFVIDPVDAELAAMLTE